MRREFRATSGRMVTVRFRLVPGGGRGNRGRVLPAVDSRSRQEREQQSNPGERGGELRDAHDVQDNAVAYAASCEVQARQRLALIGMLDVQYWHSLVAAGSVARRIRLRPRISRNTAKATMRKLITALRNTP